MFTALFALANLIKKRTNEKTMTFSFHDRTDAMCVLLSLASMQQVVVFLVDLQLLVIICYCIRIFCSEDVYCPTQSHG